jgi:hypothetical protein
VSKRTCEQHSEKSKHPTTSSSWSIVVHSASVTTFQHLDRVRSIRAREFQSTYHFEMKQPSAPELMFSSHRPWSIRALGHWKLEHSSTRALEVGAFELVSYRVTCDFELHLRTGARALERSSILVFEHSRGFMKRSSALVFERWSLRTI